MDGVGLHLGQEEDNGVHVHPDHGGLHLDQEEGGSLHLSQEEDNAMLYVHLDHGEGGGLLVAEPLHHRRHPGAGELDAA